MSRHPRTFVTIGCYFSIEIKDLMASRTREGILEYRESIEQGVPPFGRLSSEGPVWRQESSVSAATGRHEQTRYVKAARLPTPIGPVTPTSPSSGIEQRRYPTPRDSRSSVGSAVRTRHRRSTAPRHRAGSRRRQASRRRAGPPSARHLETDKRSRRRSRTTHWPSMRRRARER